MEAFQWSPLVLWGMGSHGPAIHRVCAMPIESLEKTVCVVTEVGTATEVSPGLAEMAMPGDSQEDGPQPLLHLVFFLV